MIRAVADTNVSISAFVFGGLPRTFFRLAAAGRFRLVISEILLYELEEKLKEKFHWPAERIDQTREVMMSLCEMVSPAQPLQVVQATLTMIASSSAQSPVEPTTLSPATGTSCPLSFVERLTLPS